MQNIDPALIEIEFRDGKRVNVLSIVTKVSFVYATRTWCNWIIVN